MLFLFVFLLFLLVCCYFIWTIVSEIKDYIYISRHVWMEWMRITVVRGDHASSGAGDSEESASHRGPAQHAEHRHHVALNHSETTSK